ncbi:DUF4232 domain-containing protein [Streptomyces formicae]
MRSKCGAGRVLAMTAALLTATACGASDGARTSSEAPPTASGSPTPPPTPKPTPESTDPPTGVRPCTAALTRASVADDPEGDLMLTVTNTSGAPCTAYGAPRLTFGGSSSAVAPSRDTAPKAPVTIGPGGSAYAGILMAWEPDDFVTVDTGSLIFAADGKGHGTAGEPVTVALPGRTPYEELDAEVTYWQRTREEAHADG